ncbi:YiaA/YiaB family inner membrane protein [Nocardia australiensis]|uniref:YiaA/YiaB family inner membrane protein n=1 Tax=Nocardia australiensis TaxID=2887191 RepID=UPI001D146340|nr:YiaA/YiaB family inner membrane protein [Nocardia australiensis]
MSTPNAAPKATSAFFAQAAIAFGIGLFGAGAGIFFLPLDIWQRGFLAMTVLFLVTSTFTLAKVVRDQHETTTVRSRIDEARMEKLIAEHDPFKSVA